MVDLADLNDFELLYKWITFPQTNKNLINKNKLKQEILNRYKVAPEQLSEDKFTESIYPVDKLILDLFGNIEYSSKFLYILYHKGRSIFSSLSLLFLNVGIILFILFQIGIRTDNFINDTGLLFIICIVFFLFSYIFKKISKSIFEKTLLHFKPGDIFKLLNEPDELIIVEKKINQLSNNSTVFNKTTITISKKKIICENIIKEYKDLKTKNIYKLLLLFISINYLIYTEPNESYIEYLIELGINILEYIYAFERNSYVVIYYLAKLNLMNYNFVESEKYYKLYSKIIDDDLNVKAWITIINFINSNNFNIEKVNLYYQRRLGDFYILN